ncbi:MAG TPA: acyltransferase [Oligoflexia bacterium]|nr:acyltransferase [Oligoflexia bacterium]HMR23812.1 acyltransferase [Oligoflexia bacterium]
MSSQSTNDNYFVHASSYVDEGAQIGNGTKIWHFCHIMPGATIGTNCNFGQNVVVHSKVKIGNGVKVQNNVSIYDGVTLEDHVFCGPSMVFTNVLHPRSEINRREDFSQTLVKKGATIGANATIRCGVTIGEYAFIGAGSVVLSDVPNHALVVGNPGKPKGWMCVCGHRINPGKDKLTCSSCNLSYDLGVNGLKINHYES